MLSSSENQKRQLAVDTGLSLIHPLLGDTVGMPKARNLSYLFRHTITFQESENAP